GELPENFTFNYAASGAHTVIEISDHEGGSFGTITVENTSQAQLEAAGVVIGPAAPAIAGFAAEPFGLDALETGLDGAPGMAKAAALPALGELLSDAGDAQSLDGLLPQGGAAGGGPLATATATGVASYAPPPVNPLDELEQPVLDVV